ncbi:hypothetical protein FQA39_LY00467 [Lamprigera yunnana]|nr:hypothetical protein FQA39_LY00467 [Lamprigera yunnana]
MKAIVSKLKTKLNTQRQKYKRVKKQLKSIEKTPKTRIEDMSEDITKKKELVKKTLFGEVIKIQLEENYTKLKTHEERKKFNQVRKGILQSEFSGCFFTTRSRINENGLKSHTVAEKEVLSEENKTKRLEFAQSQTISKNVIFSKKKVFQSSWDGPVKVFLPRRTEQSFFDKRLELD